ncbi:YraN family protein [Desulfoplanes sp.]
MSSRPGDVGRFGEDVACDYLTENGYRVLERNWRTRKGELDIICTRDGELVFVEVKTRGEGCLGEPGEAVDVRKKTRLVKAAYAYLTQKKLWQTPARFDLVGLRMHPDYVQVEHEKNVIDASEIMGGRNTPWQPW